MPRKMNPYLPSVTRKCLTCGKPFTGFQCEVKTGRAKYCSSSCASEGVSRFPEIVAAAPGTIPEIADRIGGSPDSLTYSIRRLCEMGRLHASGVVPNVNRTTEKSPFFLVTFAPGPSPIEGTPVSARAALTFFLCRMVLDAMPGMQSEIVARTGIPSSTVAKLVRDLRAAGKTHIARWRRAKGTGTFTPVHVVGAGVDAKCTLKRLTPQELQARFRKRLERSGKAEEYRAQISERRKHARMRTISGDPLTNALFGTPKQRKQKATQPHGGSNE